MSVFRYMRLAISSMQGCPTVFVSVSCYMRLRMAISSTQGWQISKTLNIFEQSFLHRTPSFHASSTCSMMLPNVHQILLGLCASLLASASSPFPPESDHKCYFIDGTFDAAGGPCYSNVGASLCCYSGENCTHDALCLAAPNGTPGPHDNGSSIWRRSCTDSTWQDPGCPPIAYGESS